MIDFVKLALLHGLTWFFGWSLTILLRIKSPVERIGLGGLLGTIAFSLSIIFCHWMGKFFINTQLIIGILAIYAILAGLISLLTRKLIISDISVLIKYWHSFSLIEKGLIFALALAITSVTWQNFIWPISDWDALALYDFRAMVVAETGSFASGFKLGYYFQYPPFTSLLHTATYLLDLQPAKLWYSQLFVGFMLTVYALWRRAVNRRLALLGTLLIVFQPLMIEHATMAYTNLAYTIFLSLGLFYLWLAGSRPISKYIDIILGALLIGASTWVRQTEPFWLVGMLALFSISGYFWKKKNFPRSILALSSSVIIIGFSQLWPQFLHQLNTENSLRSGVTITSNSSSSISQNLAQTVQTLLPISYLTYLNQPPAILINHLISTTQYCLAHLQPIFMPYLIIWLMSLIFVGRVKGFLWSSSIISIICIFSSILTIWLGTLIFSFSFETWDQIPGSAIRMSMFIPILLVMHTVFNLGAAKQNSPPILEKK